MTMQDRKGTGQRGFFSLRWQIVLPLLGVNILTLVVVPGIYLFFGEGDPAIQKIVTLATLAFLLAVGLIAILLTMWRCVLHPLKQIGDALQRGEAPQPHKPRIRERDELSRLAQVAMALVSPGNNREEGLADARTLLAQLSHELRTPLNAIIGFIGLVEDGIYQSDLERRDYLHNAHASAVNLLEMINDILEYSKAASGQLSLARDKLNLPGSLEDVAAFMAPQAHEKGLEIESSTVPGLPHTILGDANRLRQVLINLTANAIKFTPSGHVILRAQRHERKDGAVRLRIVVEDSGPGISRDDQMRMFDDFVQLNGKEHNTGTGLGLAISKQLVELMEGELHAESTLGQGTRFLITLPLHAAEDPPPTGEPASPLRGKRILVVSPNAAVSESQGLRLERLGAVVDLYENAMAMHSAWDAGATSPRPDALLIDDMIPTAEAAAMAESVGSHGDDGPLPVVLLVRSGVPLTEAARREVGAAGYLSKPFVSEQIDSVFTQIFDPTQSGEGELSVPIATLPVSGSRRVLVAEDNSINQKLIQALLRKKGCTVTLTGNGREALEALGREPYDLVLMDIQMPVMDGVSAAREIRKSTGERGVPVVAMTANTADEQRQIGTTGEFDDYLNKPIDPRELTRILGQWVVNAPRQPDATSGPPLSTFQVAHLDTEHIGQLASYARAHNYQIFEELVALFQLQMSEQLKLLTGAMQTEDWETLTASAAALAAIAGSFGAPRLTKLAGDMEALGSEGLRILIQDLEPQLSGECRLLHQELNERMNNQPR